MQVSNQAGKKRVALQGERPKKTYAKTRANPKKPGVRRPERAKTQGAYGKDADVGKLRLVKGMR
jgi:hypothetical protein